MNTTPDFDRIGKTVPLEAPLIVRTFAALRLCIVLFAIYVCFLQLVRIGFWFAMADRAIILLGLWVGLGIYADGIEIVWRRLGGAGRYAALSTALIILGATMLTQDSLIWFGIAMVLSMFLLGSIAYGLLRTLMDPLRTARFRQMKKFLRSLPGEKRRAMQQRLDKNFETLIAEGFH